MGLYLAVFDGDEELDGVEVGLYADFSAFREAVVANLEGGFPGSRFPTLILHSDCDGEWSPVQAALLEKELEVIGMELQRLPPVPLNDGWQRQVAKTFGVQNHTLFDRFFDVDGEPRIDRLIGLEHFHHASSAH